MTDRSELDWALLDHYLAGDSTPEEVVQIERWIGNDLDRRRLVNDLRKVWAVTNRPDRPPVEFAAIEQNVLGRIEGSTHAGAKAASRAFIPARSQPARSGAFTRHAKHWTVAIASAIALVVVAMQSRTPLPSPSAIRTYQTEPGQQANVTLANGSRALLGPATTLSVMANSSGGGTTVSVVGQVFFTVAHRHQAPFVVRTENSLTSVLGTEFMVRRYPADRVTRVVVTNGRVSVRGNHGTAANTGAVLTANTLGTIDDSGHVRATPNIATDEYTDWATGQLVFRETPVRDVIVELGRTYDADIRLSDSTLGTQALTWTVPFKEKSLTDALEFLTTVLNAHVTQSGSTITIVPGAAASRKPAGSRTSYIWESQNGR
jgi:transmembrane sensor